MLLIAVLAGYLVARALTAAREAARGGGAQGRGGRLLDARSWSTPTTSSGGWRPRSTTCSASSRGWTRRASSSSRRPRTSCARRSSRSAGSSSCSRTRTSTRTRAPSSSTRCAARSSACASSPPSCSTSRGWRRARWSCAPSRPTSASWRARSRASSARGWPSAARRSSCAPVPSRSSSTATPSASRRCVRILLDNALVHTPEGTGIVVSTARQDGHVRLEVSDTGLGIKRQSMPHIFEPFFSSDDGAQGAGLGLAIARELAGTMQRRADRPLRARLHDVRAGAAAMRKLLVLAAVALVAGCGGGGKKDSNAGTRPHDHARRGRRGGRARRRLQPAGDLPARGAGRGDRAVAVRLERPELGAGRRRRGRRSARASCSTATARSSPTPMSSPPASRRASAGRARSTSSSPTTTASRRRSSATIPTPTWRC